MRKSIFIWVCVISILLVPAIQAHEDCLHHQDVQPAPLLLSKVFANKDHARPVTIQLVDAETGSSIPGLIRIITADGGRLEIEELLNRADQLSARSIGQAAHSHLISWSVLTEKQTLNLPNETLHIEAISGLEWAMTQATIDADQHAITLPMKRFYNRREQGIVSGNVHLHLQRMSSKAAERYTTEIAQADGCDVVFFSYLEREGADKHYTSNRFTAEDLARFQQHSGVVFGWGEEYRHNFPGQPGYGHAMFLDLPELVLPASFGTDIMKQGNDDGVLRTGIQAARAQGATTLWCHNTRGLEDIPNWLAGLMDGQCIFDQGSTGNYEEGPYHLLNVGLQVPFATGTDWFIRDMALTWVETPHPTTTGAWLQALREGRSFISNGPLLSLKINGKSLGTTLDVAQGETLTITAEAVGRADFGELELVVNGVVAHRVANTRHEGSHRAAFEYTLKADEPCWIALRIPFHEGSYDKPADDKVKFNACGKPLFAHTSPIYVQVAGQGVFKPEAARALIAEMVKSKSIIASVGDYTNDAERNKVLALYNEGIAKLEAKLK